MKKIAAYLLFFTCSNILTKAFGQDDNDIQGTWNGFVKCIEERSGKLGNSKRIVFLNITQNKVSGSETYDEDVIIEGKFYQHNHCDGSGDGRLNAVSIYMSDGTYSIAIDPPECKSNDPSHGADALVGVVEIANQRLQMKNGKFNINELFGTETRVSEAPGGLMKTTTTTTWQLVRDLDMELIVTPVGYDMTGAQKSYDDWLPEPGKDETNKGSYMKIKLKLQSKSGKPLKYKAQSFELKLSNTSIEPGITINYPLSPRANQLPDLRFIPLPIAESDAQDQYITVSCNNGTTGEAYIASYDGGGATTLTVEATLEGDIHITGQLLVSGGDQDIQIPKRLPGTMIATVWQNAHGNIEQSLDNETSTGNKNNGDGLTVYEEYRGVISEGKYKRLDPKKKEVGIFISKSDRKTFDEGLKWFKTASGLETIFFDAGEIGSDRRLNKNNRSAHDFDQFVIYLKQGNLGLQNAMGLCYGIYENPDIPARVEKVIVDVFSITTVYNQWNSVQPLPFSVNEKIANVVAHELSHAVNVWHHGDLPPYTTPYTITSKNDHVIAENGFELTFRPVVITGGMGPVGGLQSGDLSCVMAYNPFYSCCYKMTSTGDNLVSYVPPINIGKSLCNSSKGTGINLSTGIGNSVGISSTITTSPILTYQNDRFFGDATKGNCLSQIKLRD